jgi:hypothetical protein
MFMWLYYLMLRSFLNFLTLPAFVPIIAAALTLAALGRTHWLEPDAGAQCHTVARASQEAVPVIYWSKAGGCAALERTKVEYAASPS